MSIGSPSPWMEREKLSDEMSSSESLCAMDSPLRSHSLSTGGADEFPFAKKMTLPELRVKSSPSLRRLSGTNRFAANNVNNNTTQHETSSHASFDSNETTDDIVFGNEIGLTAKQLRTLFPYHIAVNSDFHIVQMGSKISSFFKNKTIIKSPTYEHVGKYFRFISPLNLAWDWSVLGSVKEMEVEIEFIKDFLLTNHTNNVNNYMNNNINNINNNTTSNNMSNNNNLPTSNAASSGTNSARHSLSINVPIAINEAAVSTSSIMGNTGSLSLSPLFKPPSITSTSSAAAAAGVPLAELTAAYASMPMVLSGGFYIMNPREDPEIINYHAIFLVTPKLQNEMQLYTQWDSRLYDLPAHSAHRSLLDVNETFEALKTLQQEKNSWQEEKMVMQQEISKHHDLKHLIANVAHDLKTPLTAFLGGVEIISHTTEDVQTQIDVLMSKFDEMKTQLIALKQQQKEQMKVPGHDPIEPNQQQQEEKQEGKRVESEETVHVVQVHDKTVQATVAQQREEIERQQRAEPRMIAQHKTGGRIEATNKEEQAEEAEEEVGVLQNLQENVLTISQSIMNMKDINAFMTMTINRCIDYTKASQGLKLTPKYETIDVAEVLSLPLNVMRSLQSKMKITLNPISDEICPQIITDKQWLQENLLCLLSNAVKYSYKGEITVSIYLYHPETDDSPISHKYSANSNTNENKTSRELTPRQRSIIQGMRQRRNSASIAASGVGIGGSGTGLSAASTPHSRCDNANATVIRDLPPLQQQTMAQTAAGHHSHHSTTAVQRLSGVSQDGMSVISWPAAHFSTHGIHNYNEEAESVADSPVHHTRGIHVNSNMMSGSEKTQVHGHMTIPHSIDINMSNTVSSSRSTLPTPTLYGQLQKESSTGGVRMSTGRIPTPLTLAPLHTNTTTSSNVSNATVMRQPLPIPHSSSAIESGSVSIALPSRQEQTQAAAIITNEEDQSGRNSLSVNMSSSSSSKKGNNSQQQPLLLQQSVSQSQPQSMSAPPLPPLLVIEVEDSGIGLSEESMENLFNPFQQAQRLAGGTGLGLYSLAKRLEALNGYYGVEHRRPTLTSLPTSPIIAPSDTSASAFASSPTQQNVKTGSMFWFVIPYRPDLEMAKVKPMKKLSLLNLLPTLEELSVIQTTGRHHHNSNEAAGERGKDSYVSSSNNSSNLNTHRDGNEKTQKEASASASRSKGVLSPAVPTQISTSTNNKMNSLRVLLVDDSVTIQKMASTMLKKHGHRVDIAENGAEALDIIRNSLLDCDTEKNPKPYYYDVILMDLIMPVMDGLEAMRRIRELETRRQFDSNKSASGTVPSLVSPLHHNIIGISANAEQEVVIEALAAGADDFVCKPFTMQTFNEAVLRLEQKSHKAAEEKAAAMTLQKQLCYSSSSEENEC